MKLGRCPICHGQIHLEALVQDEAGRQLMASLVPLTIEHGTALVGYIGLFRSHNRDLANDRALRLMREVLELGGAEIAPALAEVVEAMRSKALGQRAGVSHALRGVGREVGAQRFL